MSEQPNQQEPIMNVDAVARRLGCSRHAVYAAIRRGEMRAAAINHRGDLRVRESWLQSFLDARSLTQPPQFTGA